VPQLSAGFAALDRGEAHRKALFLGLGGPSFRNWALCLLPGGRSWPWLQHGWRPGSQAQ
jgi:hypothetical protein